MAERREIVFQDLGALCEPRRNISDLRELYKWNAVPYETAKYRGTMLTALQKARPEDVSLDPGLEGYYMIYVGLPVYDGNRMRMRLSGEDEWMLLAPSTQSGYPYHSVEESFWRVADMTGQKVFFGKHKAGRDHDAMLAWLRFVPMDEASVAAWKADMERKDTKRIYATNDMHYRLCTDCPDTLIDWRGVVKDYEDSDVEWLSVENILIFDGECTTGNEDNFAFCRTADELVQRRIKKYYTKEMLADLMQYGHRQGLKMCISLRMGAWGIEYRGDQMYFANQFKDAHPELRCVDRDGSPIDALSYAYPEVREYVIDQFVQMGELGCDAVEMIFVRGVPYVLFEKPVIDRFRAEYGEDPRKLPLDDERLNKVHCAIMTEFVRELRAALDAKRGKGKVGLHARVLYSLYDSRMVAVDAEEWAKEGLVTGVISYPQRVRELLDGDVWADKPGGEIDLRKYAKYVRESKVLPIMRKSNFNTIEPVADSRGVLRGPADQKERVAEFMRLEKEYGVKVYFEIMPRWMPTLEYKARALELYDAGAERISLWDTYGRVFSRSTWSMIRRLGHKDELPGYESGEGVYYSMQRLLKVGDKDVSRYVPAWGG